MNLPQEQIDQYIARGATLGPSAIFSDKIAPMQPDKRMTVELVTPGVAMIGGNLVVIVPVRTTSEINGRDWKARSRRSGEAWNAVSRTLGPHLDLLAPFAIAYHDQKALKITFTRL